MQEGQGALALISVHEGRHIPRELHDPDGRPLGIGDPADIDRHIAYDLGAAELTTFLAQSRKAHVFRVTHSRLVADLNRFEDELECVSPRADGTEIPLNAALTADQRAARLAKYYFPALNGLNTFIANTSRGLGFEPFVVSVHSFARTQNEDPEPKAEDICVFGYPEFGRSPNLENFVEQLRVENPHLVVGNNSPFSARTPTLKTAKDDPRMACPVTFHNVVARGNVLNHFSLEICQDLLRTEDAQREMADRVSSALAVIKPQTGKGMDSGIRADAMPETFR
jgi:predicted N-formylglutamate amidohydrolase